MSAQKSIYFVRELLINSIDGRRVDLLTLTLNKNLSSSREPTIQGLFPDGRPRPLMPLGKRPVVFVSARVHPGEVPASHIMNGVLDFFTSPSDP